MSDTLSIAPVAEPVTLEEAKLHLRVTEADDDAYIDALITAARVTFEIETRRALATQTRVLRMDNFPPFAAIELPKPPLQSVTHIKYYDTNNSLQTYSTDYYWVDIYATPGRVGLVSTVSGWPSTYAKPNAVEITYVAGYTTAPKTLKQGMLLLIGHYYANREDVVSGPGAAIGQIPRGVEFLANLHRVWG